VRHSIVRGTSLDESATPPDRALAPVPTFDAWYRASWPAVVRLAHTIVGSVAVAEELAQEAFVRVHERWDTVRTPDAFVRTVVLNLARSRLRRAHLEVTRLPPSPGATTAEPALDETWIALSRLPFRQRAVLALRYYADLPEAEIAELLGCRVGTVKSAHHRALARLRKELS
jgi:RNA polymerase sigma-70 factor (sigma-E family)